jgi:hypothetical protein
MDDTIYMSVPITKSFEDSEGNLFVEGIATNDVLDLDDQIIDKDFALKGMTEWFDSWANVRQQHNEKLPPAGKAVEMRDTPEGIWLRTLVVDEGAKKLVKAGVYQAYSVGIAKPGIIADPVAKNGRINAGVFGETSLVDFPANPTAKFMIAKRAGSTVEIVEKAIELPAEKEVSFKPSDLAAMLTKLGKTTVVKEPAVKEESTVEESKVVEKHESVLPFHLSTLHDATCAAFHDTEADIPALVKIVAFQEDVQKALTSSDVNGLTEVASIYTEAVRLKAYDKEVVNEALAELRKTFSQFYPTASFSPANLPDAGSAHQFNRPYLSAGRQPMVSTGQSPRVPLTSHTIAPGDFQRGTLVEGAGRQRDAPANKEVTASLIKIHDYIVDKDNAICPMSTKDNNPDPMVSGNQNIRDNVSSGDPDADTRVGISYGDKEDFAAPVTGIDGMHQAGVNTGMHYAASPAPVPASQMLAAQKNIDDLEALFANALTVQITPLHDTIEALTKRLNDLESAPDPATAGIRSGATVTKAKEVSTGGDDTEVKAIVRLVKAARHKDSTISVPAYSKLLELYGPTNAAELLS